MVRKQFTTGLAVALLGAGLVGGAGLADSGAAKAQGFYAERGYAPGPPPGFRPPPPPPPVYGYWGHRRWHRYGDAGWRMPPPPPPPRHYGWW